MLKHLAKVSSAGSLRCFFTKNSSAASTQRQSPWPARASSGKLSHMKVPNVVADSTVDWVGTDHQGRPLFLYGDDPIASLL